MCVTALTAIQFRAEPGTILTSADSGLQLDLEIALSGVSAPNAFGVETSGDVIERVLRSAGKIVELYLTGGSCPSVPIPGK